MRTEAGPSNSSTVSDLGDLFQKHDGAGGQTGLRCEEGVKK